MSKLYNTLEQIRKNEAVPTANGSISASTSTARGRFGHLQTILLIGAGIALIGAAYLAAPRIGALINIDNSQPAVVNRLNNLPPVNQRLPARYPAGGLDSIALNKQAVSLIKNDQHWQAIRLLLQANTAAPGDIEPLINLGVAFSELGLFGPANRYFALAYGLEPGHIVLRQNMSILRAAGLLERPLSFYFTSAEMEMDKH